MSKSFEIRTRLQSFGHAFRGLAAMLRSEHNARIHLAASIMATAMGLALGLSPLEWVAVVFAMTLVWSAEAFNTALENLADALHPGPDVLVGQAKDAAAGAVLVSAFAALVTGLIIFGPKVLRAIALAVAHE